MAPQPIDILRYYRGSLEALEALDLALADPLAIGTLPAVSRFYGMTTDEVRDALGVQRGELESQVVLMLTASFESLFQQDRRDRFQRKKKGPLSKALRQWWKRHGNEGEQWFKMESLLDAWKKTEGHSHAIGRLKSLFLHRHWLAHGRYWTDRSGLGRVDPFLAWQIGKAVFNVLPGFPPLPAW